MSENDIPGVRKSLEALVTDYHSETLTSFHFHGQATEVNATLQVRILPCIPLLSFSVGASFVQKNDIRGPIFREAFISDIDLVNLFWSARRSIEAAAKRLSIDVGHVPLAAHLSGLTRYLKGIPPKPVNDGSTSRVKAEKGKARVRAEPAASDAEPKQVIVSPPELTGLIQSIIDSYSASSAPAVQEAALDGSAARLTSTATDPMSIATEKTLWSRAFKGLNESARKTATNLYV
jgi:hypothetical protein